MRAIKIQVPENLLRKLPKSQAERKEVVRLGLQRFTARRREKGAQRCGRYLCRAGRLKHAKIQQLIDQTKYGGLGGWEMSLMACAFSLTPTFSSTTCLRMNYTGLPAAPSSSEWKPVRSRLLLRPLWFPKLCSFIFAPGSSKTKKSFPKRVLRYLKRHRDVLEEVDFHKPLALLSLLRVLPLNKDALQTSYNLMTRYQLLPADSVDAALIRRHDLPALATRDDDFDHVESLDVYKP